jgi:hypothetical protein
MLWLICLLASSGCVVVTTAAAVGSAAVAVGDRGGLDRGRRGRRGCRRRRRHREGCRQRGVRQRRFRQAGDGRGGQVMAAEPKAGSMIVSNLELIPGRRVSAHFGIVQGSTVRAKHVGKDIFASFKNIVGGELKSYTELMQEAREEAIERMIAEARIGRRQCDSQRALRDDLDRRWGGGDPRVRKRGQARRPRPCQRRDRTCVASRTFTTRLSRRTPGAVRTRLFRIAGTATGRASASITPRSASANASTATCWPS